jgi:hypothetical protein
MVQESDEVFVFKGKQNTSVLTKDSGGLAAADAHIAARAKYMQEQGEWGGCK